MSQLECASCGDVARGDGYCSDECRDGAKDLGFTSAQSEHPLSPEVAADIKASIILTLADTFEIPVIWTAEHLHQFFNQAEPTERSDLDTVLTQLAAEGVITIDAEIGAITLNPERL